MRNLKKALSVFLCAVMMFTALCFFPLDIAGLEASAAVVNTGKRTALYVPEVIYLYPEVSSWKSASSAPFQYYVGNTVDTENIFAAPVAEANFEETGKIYFAAEDGMNDVELTVKFIDILGQYMAEADYGTVSFTKTDMGGYYLFEVTGGTSPVLSSDINGAYIEWCVSYKDNNGNDKAVFSYTYMYKPYMIPYGAAARIYNEKGDINAYGQHISWVSGVHSVDNTAAAKNTLYPYYLTVNSGSSSRRSFSPFLSKGNKAYAGGTEVTGAAGVFAGGYNAVFSGTDPNTAYFYAGQTGAELNSSSKAMNWFATAVGDNTYPYGSFDYSDGKISNKDASAQTVISQVTPTKLGSVRIDISRYDNLNEIPNLSVGMMLTDTDSSDGLNAGRVPASNWYVGDATGLSHEVTGTYDTSAVLSAARDAVNVKFASEENVTSPALGIKYAGPWNAEIDKRTTNKTYTAKAYYESLDAEGDYQAASSAIALNAVQVDKTELREAVRRAASYFSVLGVKKNWNSSSYDISYIDPDTNASAWNRFMLAYINASGVLTNVDLTFNVEEFTRELNSSLDALLEGKGLRVYFDVNHDDIGVNLFIPSEEKVSADGLSYTWNQDTETIVLDGTDVAGGTKFSYTPYTPSVGKSYMISIEKLSGTFTSGLGCTVIEPTDKNNNYQLPNGDGTVGRYYNFDNFSGDSTERVQTYEDKHCVHIDALSFRTWFDTSLSATVCDDFTIRLKIEEGTQKTQYSPAGKIVSTTYGTLPVPEREGYLFDGWCTDESLTTTVTSESAVSSGLLYARWVKAQYNVVFDGNGSTGGVMAEQTFTYDESGVLNKNEYIREGYVFSGWKDSEGNEYTDSDTVFNLTSVHQGKYTLYAQWTPNQYSVAFDGNTGLGGIGIINCVYDTAFQLPANYFIKTGYTFIGWSLSPDGEVLYTDKQVVDNLTSEENGSVTLYAKWRANTFTVSFDANTAEGEMADREVIYDSEAALPECGFNKTGYTFIGWSLTPDGSELVSDVQYDNLKTEEGDSVTLYAVWSENSYTLTFDKNGGEGLSIDATTYKYTDSVTLPKNVFSKKGYILSGWALTPDGEKVYENGQTVEKLNADKNGSVVLYAVWTPVNYTVSFDSQGADNTMASVNAVYGTAFTLPECTLVKTGYHFMGWALTSGGPVKYTDKEDVSDLASTEGAVVVLYAVWEINVYDVTFTYRIQDGTLVNTTVQVPHGTAAVAPSDFVSFPKKSSTEHYVFSAWSKDITNITSSLTAIARYSTTAEAHEMQEKRTESTCTVKGSIVTYCVKCAYSETQTLPLKDHSLDAGVITTAPTCLEEGTMTFSCVNCTYKTATAVAATGHSFTDVAAKAATCKEQGINAHKDCSGCLKHYPSDASVNAPYSEALSDSEVYIPALPHTPGDEADCENDQICTVCLSVITKAYGHKETTVYETADATCTNEGTYTEKTVCSVCNKVLSSTVKTGKLPHSYIETVVAPNCTDAGYTLHTCEVCSDSYKDNEKPSLGHTYSDTWTLIKESTCVENGSETNYCTVCSEAIETRALPLAPHTEGSWEVITPATCEGFGTEALNCGVCGFQITTRSIAPKGHGETKEEVTVEPGCETAGQLSTICLDCNEILSSTVIPETGHKEGPAATCEENQICLNCNVILVHAFGHKWDSGVTTKEPTETEEGEITFTCLNDASHKKYVSIPAKIVISLAPVPSDGTYDLDANESGYAGNIKDIVTVESGYAYSVTVSDSTLIAVSANGNINVRGDGEVIITVKTDDGKYEKSFTATLRTLKKVSFVVEGETVSTLKAYPGDVLAGPDVESFTDEDGFVHTFKCWSVDGTEVSECLVTGDTVFVAVFTSACDYTELDRLSAIFEDVLSGNYDNSAEILVNTAAIEEMKAEIAKYLANRDTRDIAEQSAIDNTCSALSGLISKLYPEENATLEIRGYEGIKAGTAAALKVYKMPVGTEVSDVIFTSADESVAFFLNGKLMAVKAGTVSVTASSGNLTVTQEITVGAAANARVIMFDTVLSNVNYIVEKAYVITETTNMFWATDAPITFSLIADGTFEDYQVYFNNKKVEPDANGYYTIEANTGDVHVRAEGLMKDLTDEDGGDEKFSFWELLLSFFQRIADFFRNLF
ncbi:MAG: InlB B-repeat-containing protein [Clostridia bacterium]|nr:InlB B-repeat-containing protein [Clostridia bacterium]